MQAADFVLMRNDLEDVLIAVDLARKVLARIRLNYVWALGYKHPDAAPRCRRLLPLHAHPGPLRCCSFQSARS